MPHEPASNKANSKAKRKRSSSRFHYAVETVVDRTIREQNRFLDYCQSHRIELTLFSVSGATFNGIIYDHDRETILFGGSGKSANPRLINKQFVAMVIPREGINLFVDYKGLGTARSKNRKQRFIKAIQQMGLDLSDVGLDADANGDDGDQS